MGLSESEKKVLEELERALYADDEAFARKSKSQIDKFSEPGANSPAKVIAGSLLAVMGISVLVFAAITQIVLFGVVGFLIMLVGILIASATGRQPKPKQQGKPGSTKKAEGSFFEKRWDNRSEQ
jgi:hypothetical protein